jgi:LuxR family maltose regulon positive regulatory protein
MSYLLKLQSLINKTEDQMMIEENIVTNINNVFSSLSIYDFYNVLKGFIFKKDETSIIQGWLAILSGDNLSLMKIVRRINKENLDKRYLALYYDLHALSSLSGSPEERLSYNNKALDIIKDYKDTFFYANVYLTRGQIHAGLRLYRKAADYFYESYQAFFATDMMFPSAVAMTNALLNWFKIGEFNRLIDRANKTILMMSQFQGDSKTFWDIIKLPMGMTYLTDLKIDLAKEYLLASKHAIDELKLIHMHGYSELYLFDVYHYEHDINQLNKLYDNTEKLFENMHYPFMRIILIYGKLLLEKEITVSDVQFIETYYDQTKNTGEPIVFELLFYLSMEHNHIQIDLDMVEQVIKDLRYQGDIAHLAMMLLLLSEYYFKENKLDEMYIILEEVIKLYHEDNIKFVFYRFKLSIWKYIHELDNTIKQNISKRALLTPKEQEIMNYIEKGFSNKQIAETIFVSIGTVKWHINNIYSKLNVSSRIEAVNALKK